MAQLISDTDLLNLYKTVGNDVALFNGTLSVTGMFQNKYFSVDALGQLIESATPNFTCRTSDVTSVVNGQTCVINSQTYYVKTMEPDGEGSTTILLHK